MKQCTRWSFAGFEIDTAQSTLTKSGEQIKIGQNAFRALALLVSSRGELVARDALQKEIWGDRHVDFEHGLNVCIRQIRAALGDDAEANAIVVTCPREGYRVGVPVVQVLAEPLAEVPVPIAVQPDSVPIDGGRRFPSWAAAAAVLIVLAAGAWLIDEVSDNPTSAASEDSADAANPASAKALPTTSSEAYSWYWRGRGYYDRSTGRRPAWALPYFETAATLDPNFALAHAALAVSYLDRAATGVARAESLEKARRAAERALLLGPNLAETHVALAELGYRLDRDVRKAETEFTRAFQLDDHNAYARQRYAAFLHDQRHFDDALAQLRIAYQLDPRSIMTNWHMANELFYLGQYGAAVAQANKTLELDPTHAWSFRTLGQSLEALGKEEDAIAAYLKAGQVALGHLGRAYVITGRPSEARKLLDSLIKEPFDGTTHNGAAIAFIYTALGEPKKAAEWLEKTQRDGVRLPFSLEVAPQWESLRESPSFDQLKKKAAGGA